MDECLPLERGSGSDALHNGVGPSDASGGVDGDDRLLHAVEESGQFTLSGFEGLKAGLKACSGGVKGVRNVRNFVEVALLNTCREVSGSDAIGEDDDSMQPG